MIKYYLQIIKPGIIFGNITSFVCSFLFFSNNIRNFSFFILTLGISFIIASSCIFNNIIDFDIDQKMERTKNRYFIVTFITIKNSIYYGILLGLTGFFLIYLNSNFLTFLCSLIGFFIYVILYSLYFKRNSKYGIFVGGISGTIPSILGSCAVKNDINFSSIILFFIFFIWQIPHFYSISILYLDDYKNINLPILPVMKNIYITKNYIKYYVLLFIFLEITLTILNYTGYFYLFFILITGIIWFLISLKWCKSKEENFWAKKFFIFSIIAIIIFNIMISIDFKSK